LALCYGIVVVINGMASWPSHDWRSDHFQANYIWPFLWHSPKWKFASVHRVGK
jgi:hypothetical protein